MENQEKATFNDQLRERTIQMAAALLEECDETLFWLDYLIRIDLPDIAKTKEIYTEVEQLVRLFNAIKSKMKIKIGS